MRIKKIAPVTPANGNIENSYGTSQENTYSQEYINKFTDYSTTEQVVGKWIDGKPLYRKVVSMGTLPSSQGVIASTDTYTNVKRLYGYAYGSNNVVLPLPYCDYQTIDASVSIIINSSNKIEIGVGRNRSAYTSYAIVEYTKTTD